MVLQMVGRDEDVAGIEIEGHDIVEVQERPSSRPLKNLITGVREWITIVSGSESHSDPADRGRNRELNLRHYREQSQLHWPDGVRVSGLSERSDRARWN